MSCVVQSLLVVLNWIRGVGDIDVDQIDTICQPRPEFIVHSLFFHLIFMNKRLSLFSNFFFSHTQFRLFFSFFRATFLRSELFCFFFRVLDWNKRFRWDVIWLFFYFSQNFVYFHDISFLPWLGEGCLGSGCVLFDVLARNLCSKLNKIYIL